MAVDIRLLLIGMGNLGRRFCDIIEAKNNTLQQRYGYRLLVVGAADSRGTAVDPAGLDLQQLSAIKMRGGSVADLPNVGHRGEPAIELIRRCPADILCEASPVNLSQGGEPGLSHIRLALEQGLHVVTPNKGPLVLAFQELHALAKQHQRQLRFDGTVAGGLPAIYLGQRDLRGAEIQRIEAVPNLATGFIMDLLAEGLSWEEARIRGRREGVLEDDASWDIDGWDAAAKLVIMVNALMDYPARLEDVCRQGIADITAKDVWEARREGKDIKVLALADRLADGSVSMQVQPIPLPAKHPLAGLGPKEMGVVYYTDIYGVITAKIEELTPVPSAATMLRDILDILEH
jgi:homoserine dehydrogenase